MQISDDKDGKISTEILIRVFLNRLYDNKEINSITYFNAMEKLEEEKGYVNK